MKILLIPTHLVHVRAIPLGIAYIASYLKTFNHDVDVYDPPPYEKYDVVSYIKKHKPDIIGISCMTPTHTKALALAQNIKKVFSIPIIFGGIHPTSLPEETLKNDCVDYVVVGEGEYTVKALLDALENNGDFKSIKGLGFKNGKQCMINNNCWIVEPLDQMPMPGRELFPLHWYFQRCMGIRGEWVKITNMISSRGCPYLCTYCASHIMFGRRVRYISPEKVVNEVEFLIHTYRLDGVSFSDDTFSVDRDRAVAICEEIKRRKLSFVWRVQMRADTVDERVAAALAQAGCIQVDMGVESGSPAVLKRIHKGITPEQTIESVALLKKHNLRVCATFMIGNPDETLDDIEMTRDLAKRMDADYTQFFITTPYPGTSMYEELFQKDPLYFSRVSYDDFFHGGSDAAPLVKSSVPSDTLKQMYEDLNKEFLKRVPAVLMIKNIYFLIDMVFLMIQKPSIIVKSIVLYLKTFNILPVFRLWYEWQNLRRWG